MESRYELSCRLLLLTREGGAPQIYAEGEVPVFYKVAWLLKSCHQRATLLAEARQLGLPLFEGFMGFVKRSERRCGKPVSLRNSECASDRTILLHHPILLAENSVLEEVSGQLVQLFAQMGKD